MIDKGKLFRSLLVSWGYTLMGMFNLAVMFGFALLIVIRFRGPAAVAPLIVPTIAVTLAICCLAEVLVNFIYNGKAPDPTNELDRRFVTAVKKVSRRAWMLVTPRAWVLHRLPAKNAMTYGLPFPGLCAIGITREMVEATTDDELEAVIAHECGHIKCRDTMIMLVISLFLGMINKLYYTLRGGQSIWTKSPITLAAGWVVYLIGKCAFAVSRFSISQEREFSADALAVLYMGSAEPVSRMLNKLLEEQKGEDSRPGFLFSDLMASHPGLEERISEVESLMVRTERSA